MDTVVIIIYKIIIANKIMEEQKESIEKMKICVQCDEFLKLTKQCKKCGCFMPIKVLLPKQKCPMGKW